MYTQKTSLLIKNIFSGGAPGSYHLLGMAVDIHVKDYLLSDLLTIAQEIGFNGIGFYEKKDFLHLDIRPG